MKWITVALTIATLAGLVTYTPAASGQDDSDAAPIYGIKIPKGYRDWTMISIAHVGEPVNGAVAFSSDSARRQNHSRGMAVKAELVRRVHRRSDHQP